MLGPGKGLKRTSKVKQVKVVLQGEEDREDLLVSHCRALFSHRERRVRVCVERERERERERETEDEV